MYKNPNQVLLFNELRGKLILAYCPERVLPGNIMYELVNNDRVIGGVNDASTEKAINFLNETDSLLLWH